MSSTKPFEVKGAKAICIKESELYKAIKSLSFFCRLGFEKGAKDSKITKSILPSYRANLQEKLLAGLID